MKANDTILKETEYPKDYITQSGCGVTFFHTDRLLEQQAAKSFKEGIKEAAHFARHYVGAFGGISIPQKVWEAKLKEWGIDRWEV